MFIVAGKSSRKIPKLPIDAAMRQSAQRISSTNIYSLEWPERPL